MNISELDDALSNALNALSAAQLTLRKGASPRDLDILRKAFLGDYPRASTAMQGGDAIMKRSQHTLDDLNARMAVLEAAQTTRKTYTITGAQS
jgi:hypothetical protein